MAIDLPLLPSKQCHRTNRLHILYDRSAFHCSEYILHCRHNGHDGVSNHLPYDCLLDRLFGRRSQKTSKLRVTGLRVGNSPWTGEIPARMASNVENVSIWWRHHDTAHHLIVNKLRQRQNGHYFADDIFKYYFLEWKALYFDWNLTKVCRIDNTSALVQ